MAEHSKHSFSGSHRWIKGHCPASIRMSAGYPESTNPAAERGTCAHELGEFSYSLGINIRDTLGLIFNEIEVDRKMIDDVAIYTGYLQQQTLVYGIRPLLEQRVVMTSMGRDDVFGTSDCNFIIPDYRAIEVADYKNGYGIVEVQDNPQTAGYGVATLDTFDLWDKVDSVKNTIIQPNGNHCDGPIRSCVYTIDQMRWWQDLFRESIALTEDKSQRPNAGEWCHYCPAQANCRARVEYVLEVAYTQVPFEELSIPELEIIYANIGSVKAFLEKVEARVFSLAMKGKKFDGYKVVASYGRASCKDEKPLVDAAVAKGIDPGQLYNVNLKSKTDLKRMLPSKVVDACFVSPEPGRKLVPLHDNSPALRINGADSVFNDYLIKD